MSLRSTSFIWNTFIYGEYWYQYAQNKFLSLRSVYLTRKDFYLQWMNITASTVCRIAKSTFWNVCTQFGPVPHLSTFVKFPKVIIPAPLEQHYRTASKWFSTSAFRQLIITPHSVLVIFRKFHTCILNWLF